MKKNLINSRSYRCYNLLGLMMLLLYSSGCFFISAKVGPFLGGKEPMEEFVVSGEGKEKILLIDISGIITDFDDSVFFETFLKESIVSSVKEQLEKARDDNDIKALVLRINSPGGTVTASDIVYNEIKRFKDETGVKVISCLMDVGASGAYFIAMSSDRVIAHPTTLTGSIGVIFENFNVEGLFDKLGIKDATIKSGDKKDIGSPFREITGEEKKILQEVNDNLYSRFIDVVDEGREELDREMVKKLADGRIYSAGQALKEKLIDEIGYLDDAIEVAKEGAGLKRAKIVMYKRPGGYANNVYSKAVPSSALNLMNPGTERLISYFLTPKFMYLWAPGKF